MKTCKNCQHWYRFPNSRQKSGICEYPGGHETEEEKEIPEDGFSLSISVLDDSGLSVQVRTGPNFGCLKHKERNKKQ